MHLLPLPSLFVGSKWYLDAQYIIYYLRFTRRLLAPPLFAAYPTWLRNGLVPQPEGKHDDRKCCSSNMLQRIKNFCAVLVPSLYTRTCHFLQNSSKALWNRFLLFHGFYSGRSLNQTISLLLDVGETLLDLFWYTSQSSSLLLSPPTNKYQKTQQVGNPMPLVPHKTSPLESVMGKRRLMG